ncbi:C39 family peptidase [Aerococcaceae bacterium WGS1372]
MAKKKAKQTLQTISSKFILMSFLVIILIGIVVMVYLYFHSDTQYREYYVLRDQYAQYLLENQGQIIQKTQEDQIDAQEVGHVFIPEFPSEYVDIQHIDQYNVPYMNQNDPRWKDKYYGTDGSQTIWENGCAIVVLAMVDSYFQEKMTRPDSLAIWAGDNYYIDSQGSSWSIYQAFGQEYGYQVEDLANDFYKAVEYLERGNLIVVSVGPGTFTDGGHVMLIRGYQDGLVYLNDPNDSPAKFFSIQGIPAQIIIDDALNYWAIAP